MSASKDIAKKLKQLQPVRKGQSVLEVASSDRINAIQDIIMALIRGDNIVDGANVYKKSGDGYVILSSRNTGGFGAADACDVPDGDHDKKYVKVAQWNGDTLSWECEWKEVCYDTPPP